MSERRNVGRTRIRHNAEIVVDQPGAGKIPCVKIPCTLQDLTSTGACLTLAGSDTVPDTFELTFDKGRSRRPCRVKWRTGDKLGIAFDKPAA